ncbi:MAG: putative molybdenum carrier protein, partial [Bacteroidales bacterium]|nr:putative molybdenum carrier protein [Bacteroidales bacterium]
KISKLISGGQTGVDRAALDFALAHQIECGGWCPKGRIAEDGIIPLKYPLTETSGSDYRERTRLNVKNGNGTLIFINGYMDEGTKLTMDTADDLKKPCFIHDFSKSPEKEKLLRWLSENKIKTLNIAGPRESNSLGIYGLVYDVLKKIF